GFAGPLRTLGGWGAISGPPMFLAPPPIAHGVRQLGQHAGRRVPAHARVGDRLPVAQRATGGQILPALDEEALHHHADDRRLTARDLARDVVADHRLPAVILAAVAVTAVDHQPRRQAGVAERRGGLADVGCVVIRAALPTAQDDVAVGIAARGDDRAKPLLGNAEEPMRVRARADGVDGELHVAVGAGLQAEVHREAGGRLAMDLALARARAGRAP